MAPGVGGLTVGGDVEHALAGLPVPSYVLDTTGVVRWLNPAAERLLGDVRGRHFTSIVGPEDKAKAQELFARKVLGTTAATEASGVFVSTDGTRLRGGERGAADGRRACRRRLRAADRPARRRGRAHRPRT